MVSWERSHQSSVVNRPVQPAPSAHAAPSGTACCTEKRRWACASHKVALEQRPWRRHGCRLLSPSTAVCPVSCLLCFPFFFKQMCLSSALSLVLEALAELTSCSVYASRRKLQVFGAQVTRGLRCCVLGQVGWGPGRLREPEEGALPPPPVPTSHSSPCQCCVPNGCCSHQRYATEESFRLRRAFAPGCLGGLAKGTRYASCRTSQSLSQADGAVQIFPGVGRGNCLPWISLTQRPFPHRLSLPPCHRCFVPSVHPHFPHRPPVPLEFLRTQS